MKPYFIDEKINILKGDAAIEALSKENDKKFLSKDKGVVKVSFDRWQKAQQCEKKHWLVHGKQSADDRNYYHFLHFNNYLAIKNMNFSSALEIGCGPFTNLRLLLDVCNLGNCSLLDPLINDYFAHPFCSYDKKSLFSEKAGLIPKAIRKLFPSAYKFYLKTFAKKAKIKNIFNVGAEMIPRRDKYDLVVMINVLEHCYDAELIFQNILEITKHGSYFIFSDKFYSYEQVINEITLGYDAAHPLKVDRKVIEKFLFDNFDIIYKRIQTNAMNLEEDQFVWDDIYFIGKKK